MVSFLPEVRIISWRFGRLVGGGRNGVTTARRRKEMRRQQERYDRKSMTTTRTNKRTGSEAKSGNDSIVPVLPATQAA